MTIQQRAQEIFDAMEQRTRPNGEKYYCLKEGYPSWMLDVVHDTIYEVINEVVATLADADPDADIDQLRDVIMEIKPDVYTSQLTAWLNDSNYNVYYLTEALEEGTGIKDGFQLLARAQYLFKQEIANSLLEALQELEGE